MKTKKSKTIKNKTVKNIIKEREEEKSKNDE